VRKNKSRKRSTNNSDKSIANKSHINKATVEQRANKSETGTVGIEFVKQVVDILKPFELSESQRLKTFQLMMLDDSVSDAFTTNAVFVEEAFSNYSVEFDNTSETSRQAAEFLKWNLNHLQNQSVRSIARSAIEFKRDGVAPFEKIFERSYGEWATTPSGLPAWKIKKLNYISPLTLYEREPFVLTQGGNKITEMRQSTNAFKNSGNMLTTKVGNPQGYISIPISKVLLTTYSATDAQPFGRSPFESCYTAWREKVLLQDLTSVGVSKDLAGTPILLLPASILNDAAADPSSDAGRMVAELKESMANLHAGDQASMIMPSDTFNEAGSGAKEFEIKFLGVDGGGKNFDLEKLVEQRRKFIYSTFGASNLISNDSSGGYNQLEGQTNLHYHFIERDISVIEESWNMNLIPQLFRLNEWELTFAEMPKVKAGAMSPASIDELGKWAQRLGATGLFPKTVGSINELLEKSGFTYRIPENTSKEELTELLGEMTTKSGQALESGMPNGTGDSLGNNSSTNSNNAS